MKCYNHPNVDAVVSCECGRGLCSDCSQHYRTNEDGTRRIICKECYDHLNALQKKEEKAEASSSVIKYIFMTLWTGVFIAIGFYKSDMLSSEAWNNPLFWWAFGGLPVLFIKGFFAWSLFDQISASSKGGCFYVIFKFIFWFVIAALACPLIFLYSLIKTIISLVRKRKINGK